MTLFYSISELLSQLYRHASMHCRFFLVFFLYFFAQLGIADSGVWNCEKVKGKEWSCSSSSSVDNETGDSEIVQPELATEKSIIVPVAESVPEKLKPVYIPPPKTIAKRPGWTCTSNEENETWNCNLIGADPEGRAKTVADGEESIRLIEAAFDFNQEQIFATLHSQLKYDPWENCTARSSGGYQYVAGKDSRNTAPMDVTADYSEVFDKEITSFFGNVEIIRADQKVLSDAASYDTVSETMDAQGHVFYSEDELSLYSDTALLNLGSDEARLRNALFITPAAPLRGRADVVYRDSKFLSRYTDVAFTSCRPGNQDWVVHAERLKMNKQTGKAAAKHAWLEFKGIPVIYTPYISFPLDDRRISGLLAPTFGSSDKTGLDLVVPYYWNIAPNYDLTVWPRYMSKRGGMLSGDFRYLAKKTSGSLGLEYLPYDTIRQEARYSGTVKNKTQFTSNLSSNVDINYVSDDEYFDELNNALGISTDRHLKSQADLRYNQEGVLFFTHLETYQTIDRDIDDNDKPYQTLPQVVLNLDHAFEEWPVDLAMDNEYVHFYRNGRVNGHRFNTKPSIAFPIETAGSFFKPKISLQHTQYILEDQPVGKREKISRTLPILSVDNGLIFERDFNSSYRHTIEPRLFYLYIPEKKQENIPAFDTSLNDFSFYNMFRENRFSGVDRVQDANQLTVAMTSRLIDSKSGQERLKFSIGDIIYFKDRKVTLPDEDDPNKLSPPETHTFSNVVVELSGQLTDHLSFSSGIQWNPDANDITRGQGQLRYRNQPDQIINLGYRYRRDDLAKKATIIQTDASFRWPLFDNWYGVGRWQYSLRFNSTKESFLGVEKESCCWRFRIIWRRYANSVSDSSDNETDEGIFVQLELKGLTSIGDKVDEFLENNLYGYQRAE